MLQTFCFLLRLKYNKDLIAGNTQANALLSFTGCREHEALCLLRVSLIIHLFISNQYFSLAAERVSVTLTMVCCTFGHKAFDFMDDLNPQWLKTI